MIIALCLTGSVPPELPPRSTSPGHGSPSISVSQHHGVSSSWHGQQPATLVSDVAPSPAPVALGRSHSAVMSTSSTPTHTADTTSSTLGRSSGNQLLTHVSTAVTPPPNVSVTAVTSRSTEKVFHILYYQFLTYVYIEPNVLVTADPQAWYFMFLILRFSLMVHSNQYVSHNIYQQIIDKVFHILDYYQSLTYVFTAPNVSVTAVP